MARRLLRHTVSVATGRATCTTSIAGELLVVLHGGYTVSYAGTGTYLPSSSSGGLISIR
jgi:hypothetical protein